jgi:hypothetical protein
VGRRLPPATLSRCIFIELRRCKKDEEVDEFKQVDDSELADLRQDAEPLQDHTQKRDRARNTGFGRDGTEAGQGIRKARIRGSMVNLSFLGHFNPSHRPSAHGSKTTWPFQSVQGHSHWTVRKRILVLLPQGLGRLDGS